MNALLEAQPGLIVSKQRGMRFASVNLPGHFPPTDQLDQWKQRSPGRACRQSGQHLHGLASMVLTARIASSILRASRPPAQIAALSRHQCNITMARQSTNMWRRKGEHGRAYSISADSVQPPTTFQSDTGRSRVRRASGRRLPRTPIVKRWPDQQDKAPPCALALVQ
jgi:hypothetical protein